MSHGSKIYEEFCPKCGGELHSSGHTCSPSPRDEQISALQQQVAELKYRLRAWQDGDAERHAKDEAEVERLTTQRAELWSQRDAAYATWQPLTQWDNLRKERDTLKRYLNAIAGALGLDKHPQCFKCLHAAHGGRCPVVIFDGQPNKYCDCDCVQTGAQATTAYLPDQLPEMVKALRQALEKIATWPPSYPCNQNIVRVMEHARAVLDARIKEQG